MNSPIRAVVRVTFIAARTRSEMQRGNDKLCCGLDQVKALIAATYHWDVDQLTVIPSSAGEAQGAYYIARRDGTSYTKTVYKHLALVVPEDPSLYAGAVPIVLSKSTVS